MQVGNDQVGQLSASEACVLCRENENPVPFDELLVGLLLLDGLLNDSNLGVRNDLRDQFGRLYLEGYFLPVVPVEECAEDEVVARSGAWRQPGVAMEEFGEEFHRRRKLAEEVEEVLKEPLRLVIPLRGLGCANQI